MVVLGGGLFLMSEVPLAPSAQDLEPELARQILSDTMYLSINFRKLNPPQNR